MAEEIKKRISKKVVYKINSHLIKNNITIIKLYATQTLLNKNIAIYLTKKKNAEKFKRKDS